MKFPKGLTKYDSLLDGLRSMVDRRPEPPPKPETKQRKYKHYFFPIEETNKIEMNMETTQAKELLERWDAYFPHAHVDKLKYEDFLATSEAIKLLSSWMSIGNHPEKKWVLLHNGYWTGVGMNKKPEDHKSGEPEWIDETTEYITPEPTHWMPLPQPPKTKKR